MTLTHTMIQAIVPDGVRGRVGAIYSVHVGGMMAAANLSNGVLADYIDAPLVLGIGGVAFIAVMFVTWNLDVFRRIYNGVCPDSQPRRRLWRAARLSLPGQYPTAERIRCKRYWCVQSPERLLCAAQIPTSVHSREGGNPSPARCTAIASEAVRHAARANQVVDLGAAPHLQVFIVSEKGHPVVIPAKAGIQGRCWGRSSHQD